LSEDIPGLLGEAWLEAEVIDGKEDFSLQKTQAKVTEVG
jgi:hypothetical protein